MDRTKLSQEIDATILGQLNGSGNLDAKKSLTINKTGSAMSTFVKSLKDTSSPKKKKKVNGLVIGVSPPELTLNTTIMSPTNAENIDKDSSAAEVNIGEPAEDDDRVRAKN